MTRPSDHHAAAARIREALDGLPPTLIDSPDVEYFWVQGKYGDGDMRMIRADDLRSVLDEAEDGP